MKESLIGSVVGTVTGAAETTTSALTGTTTTSPSKTTSSTASPSTSPSTSAPASTTSTPSSTPSPAKTAADLTSDSSAGSSSVSNSAFSLITATPTETTAAPSTSSSSINAGGSSRTNSNSASLSASGLSGSSSTQLSQEQSQANVSLALGNSTGSSSQGSDEAGVGVTADNTGISTGSIVILVLDALGALLLCVLLATWCLRRSRRHLMSSVSHVRLGATGNIPVFNTRGTERFETSSTSVSFGQLDTARLNSDEHSTSEGPRRSGLWDDEVIAAMRIPMEKLTTTKLLSSGGYGEVYRGLYREQPVALKVLLPENRKDLDQINAFLAEIKMMATIDHPCIVQFIAVAWDSLSDLSAVMQFMEGGDLRSLLDRFTQEQRPRGFDLDKARIALQTVQALTYLHSLDPNVLHRDLKSRNILLTSSMNAKVSDFGAARNYSFTSMTAAVGTSLWMAPEVMLGDRYDTSADIFSFGIVLSELDSHLHPYAESRMSNSGQRVPDAALLQLVAMGRVTVNFSANAPTELVELGRACVSLDPLARPSASEVHYRLQLILQSYELYTV